MNIARRQVLPLLVLVGAVAGACTGTEPAALQTPSPSATTSPGVVRPTPSPEAHPVSIQALLAKSYDGRDLKLQRVLARNGAYTRYFATYRSGALTISGVMNIPRGSGPYPVLILNHGYRDTATYVNGEGLPREQDYLARNGYAVLHTDFRNHAQSDDDPKSDLNLRLGYVEDAINAVLAVKASAFPQLDRERVGMLGRSMGGGVTLGAAVVRPDLLKAAVLYSSVSSNAVDNFNKYTRNRRDLANRIVAAYGAPANNSPFWRNVSTVNFLDRPTMPILMHHGTQDLSTPLSWSQKTLAVLRSHGKNVEMFVYQGQPHVFTSEWTTSIRRTVAFLDRYMKA